jgi:hypothetical protein
MIAYFSMVVKPVFEGKTYYREHPGVDKPD